MSEERAILAYEHYREESQRFEYFVVGLSVGLCAYVGQTLPIHKLDASAYTLEVAALAFLVASIAVGFKLLEAVVLVKSINADVIHLRERRGKLVGALNPAGMVDQLSGEAWTPLRLKKEIDSITNVLPSLESQLRRVQKKIRTLYAWRNILLAIGFIGLCASKVLMAYLP